MLYIFFFYSENSQLLDIMLHNQNPESAHCAEHKMNLQKDVLENLISCQDFVTGIAIIINSYF